MKYAEQMRLDGSAAPIIPGMTGAQSSLFAVVDLPDVTYAGTVLQPTLDGDVQRRPTTLYLAGDGTR